MAYWIYINGSRALTEDGVSLLFDTPSVLPDEPPKQLASIFTARTLIDDPLGVAAAGITYARELPDAEDMAEGAVISTGDGLYSRVSGGLFYGLVPVYNDATILTSGGSDYDRASIMIARMLAAIDPSKYITSFSTGGQSTSFASYADYRQHFLDLQAVIDSMYGGSKVARYNGRPIDYAGCWE